MPDSIKNKNIFVIDENKKSGEAKRKMAAIFAADVVGYSTLMASNEKLTLFRLKETRKITDKIINELHGRIFSTAGDSIMAEFASPVDAMEAAISIQNQVSENVKKIEDAVKITFRIGINLGDIMTQDNNLYGDNVNIAARLESIAAPGEINISEKVYQEVYNKVSISFKSLGEKKLKNISQKIKVYSSVMKQDNNININRLSVSYKKYLFTGILLIISVITTIYFYNQYFKNKIEYTDNSKSVLENFRADKTSEGPNKANTNSGKTVIALMDIQNQSNAYDNASFMNIKSILNDAFLNENNIAVVSTPQGSENLNPPEVMLIATESDASFVINGIIYDEEKNIYLNLKIYEAKRGSLILNKKISLKNTSDLEDFVNRFTKDITKEK
jgi:class 3 adenylate cyclase